MVERINNENLDTAGSTIADEIRKEITNGTYKTGDKIREAQLCEKYGVSRTPIREAFRLLQNEGILVHIPQCGVQVAKFGEEEAMHLLQVRASLEYLSASEATRFITDEEIQTLRKINDDIRKFDEKYAVHSVDLDKNFHMVIAKASRNPYVAEYLENVILRNQLVKYIIPFRRNRIPHTYKEHEDIIHALEIHDSYLAEVYMKVHFHNSIISIDTKIKEYEADSNQKKRKKKR